MSWNQIFDLAPLSGLVQLRWLDLGNNRIIDISGLSGLTQLQHLNLYQNQITNTSALSGMVHLEKLALYQNRVIDLSLLAGLRNQVTDICALLELSSLTYLDIMNNPLNDQVCELIRQIIADNPGVSVVSPRCDPPRLSVCSSAGGSVTSPGEGEFAYEHGSTVILTAEPGPGFRFSHWSGSFYSTENPVMVDMFHDHDIRASFISTRETLYVDDDAPGDPRPEDTTASDP